MAGASDKARFYLEQYVPELQEHERKEIFSHEEITAIARKRSDFEHIINARGSKPADYVRYATYETNLDSLRKKRCKRKGVKSTAYSGQRTIFFILDRATKKFPGDMGLWMQYIQFCQKEKANKKLTRVFTNVLRLKPREWGLWVLAAKHYAETQGDMSAARSYMQRGLRFCRDERKLWLEYMKLEMVYLAKLAARRKVLGLDDQGKDADAEDENEEIHSLAAVTAGDVDPNDQRGIEEVDDDALKNLATAPVYTGAIPIAIFDSAIKQFNGDAQFANAAFDLCADFGKVPASQSILQHILGWIHAEVPETVEAIVCKARMVLFGIDLRSEDFPAALGSSLSTMKHGQSRLDAKTLPQMAEHSILLLIPYLRSRDDLDEDVATVLEASIRCYLKTLSSTSGTSTVKYRADPQTALLERLHKDGRPSDVAILESLAVR
jgi:U3 small nucleolar RNA-associated protein 6